MCVSRVSEFDVGAILPVYTLSLRLLLEYPEKESWRSIIYYVETNRGRPLRRKTMASNVIRVMSRRVCLGLKTRAMVEVRPLSLMSTPHSQPAILSGKVNGTYKYFER